MTNLNEIVKKVKGYKVVNLAELKTINKESIAKGYNRNLNMKSFMQALKTAMYETKGIMGCWRGMKTNVMLRPLFEHNHKGGVECEPHLPCHVQEMGLVCRGLTLDVPFSTFNELTEVTDFVKEVA